MTRFHTIMAAWVALCPRLPAAPWLRRPVALGRAGLVALALLASLVPLHAQPQPPSNLRHQWERMFYGQWEKGRVLLHNSSIQYGKLAFGDLDGDGDPDLLVGKSNGRIDWFRNDGKPGRPVWVLAIENITALRTGQGGSTVRVTIDTGNFAAPALVDLDQDQDLDLVVGAGDGRLIFFRNIGNPVFPAFELEKDTFVSRDFGSNLVPRFVDVDNNRSPDLLLGNRKGEVFLLVNQGTRRREKYCSRFPPPDSQPGDEPPCRPTPVRLLTIGPESDATPGMVDWDGDGDLDLFVGKSNGTIAYFENKGNAFSGEWRLVQNRFLAIDEGGFAAPSFLDVNGDGRADMVIGSSTDSVSVYTNQGAENPLDVWKVTGNLLNIRRIAPDFRKVVLASGDLDGDGDLDLIAGDRAGRMLWLENIGTPAQPAWSPRQSSLLGAVLRRHSAPLLADLDGDGDLDLLMGGENGRIWLLRNRGTQKKPAFALESTNFAAIDVGNDSVPVTLDLDGDGDLDLFVGNRKGLIIYYRNQGTAAVPDFRLASTNFGGVSVNRNAAPAFFDWNLDKRPDLVVGGAAGKLVLDVNMNEPKDSEARKWSVEGERWGNFQASGFSAPHFLDLNKDGRPDLLLADGDGNVQLWWNRGDAPKPSETPETAEATRDEGGEEAGPVSGLAPGAPVTQSDSGLQGLVAPDEDGDQLPATAADILSQPLQTTGPITPVLILAERKYADLSFTGRAAPSFGDVDGDGDLDLVVGAGKGALVFFRNEGTAKKAKWSKVTERLAGFKAGGSPSPLLWDLDGDKKVDLIVGTERGRLLFYKNTGENYAQPFVLVEGGLAGINVRRNASPAAVLVNQDGDVDLVVGNLSGKLLAFIRRGGPQSLKFKLEHRRYLGVDVGVASTPFAGDLNRDQAPDLLIGSDQGNLTFFTRAQVGKPNAWGWSPDAEVFKGLKFPPASRPVLADVDGDGDLDLFVGSEKGAIYFYRNDAIKTEDDS